MNHKLKFLFSRPASYALSGIGTGLALVLPGPSRIFLLTAVAANLAVNWRGGRKSMKRWGLPLVCVVTLGLLIPRPAAAIFGLGDVVFDPSAYAALLQQFAQLQQTYQNAVRLYTTTVQSYEIAKRNILSLGNKDTYKTLGLSMIGSHVPDHFGELNGWNAAANNGVGIPAAYQNATLPLSQHTSFLSQETLGSSAHLADLARISITDSTSQNSLATMAQILQQQRSNQNPVSQWESSIYSQNPDLNTAAAQQNLTNLGLVQMYEQGKANLAVNSILAQQMMLQNMKDRNAAVSDLNFWQKVAEHASTPHPTLGGIGHDILNHQPY